MKNHFKNKQEFLTLNKLKLLTTIKYKFQIKIQFNRHYNFLNEKSQYKYFLIVIFILFLY